MKYQNCKNTLYYFVFIVFFIQLHGCNGSSGSTDTIENKTWVNINSPTDDYILNIYSPVLTMSGSVSENYIPREIGPVNFADITVHNSTLDSYGFVEYNGTSWKGTIGMGEGENIIIVTAKDSTNIDTDTVTVNVPSVNLSNILLEGGQFNEEFQKDRQLYTSDICYNSDQVRLKIDVANEYILWKADKGEITDDGFLEINLEHGVNTVNLHVFSTPIGNKIDSENNYTINIVRGLDTGATLKYIELSAGWLDNILDPYQYTISATLDYADDAISITATTADPCATVRVRSQVVEAGGASDIFPIGEGPNMIDISVDDGVGYKNYELIANRDPRATYTQTAYIKPPQSTQDRSFGKAIDIEGNILVIGEVGAYVYERDAGNGWTYKTKLNGGLDVSVSAGRIASSDREVVYIYERDSAGVWQLQAEVRASNAETGDNFGFSIALNGDTLAVGAAFEDSPSSGINADQGNYPYDPYHASGAAYVFRRDANSDWLQTAYIKASNPEGRDYHIPGMHPDWFGTRVALEADTLVVSAINEDSCATGVNGDEFNHSCTGAGAAYVFNRNTSNEWAQVAYIKSSDTWGSHSFGHHLAIGNETLAISAYGTPYKGGKSEVYIFIKSVDGDWIEQERISASNDNSSYHELLSFGSAVALYDNTLIVGAATEDSISTGVNSVQTSAGDSINAGAAYMFVRDINSTWSQEEYIKASNTDAGDKFGCSVSLSVSALVVGACNESSKSTGINGNQSDNSYDGSGAVYVYE